MRISMSLRYRLFLRIGGLFFVAFIFSFFWENYLTKKDLKKVEGRLRSEIFQLNEEKRKYVEKFLAEQSAMGGQAEESARQLAVVMNQIVADLEEKEFAFVHQLDQGAKKVLDEISWNMRMVALVALCAVLILLNRLARRITEPIARLAKAAQEVGSGQLEGIDLPQLSSHRHDEIALLCSSFAEMVRGLREKEKVKGVLDKVVSQEIAQEILKGNIHLGGEEKEVTVLFADIRDFTHLTRKMPPQEIVALLNGCMTKISRVVDKHDGVIDKYVGDEVMALFGAPVAREESALQAILAALEMLAVLKTWNEERKGKGLFAVEMGIGIHTGIVLAGNMGAENRLNYTVLGQNVNLASRLCAAAKGMQILISKSAWEVPAVQARIAVEPLPPLSLKGFDAPVPVYWVKGEK